MVREQMPERASQNLGRRRRKYKDDTNRIKIEVITEWYGRNPLDSHVSMSKDEEVVRQWGWETAVPVQRITLILPRSQYHKLTALKWDLW